MTAQNTIPPSAMRSGLQKSRPTTEGGSLPGFFSRSPLNFPSADVVLKGARLTIGDREVNLADRADYNSFTKTK